MNSTTQLTDDDWAGLEAAVRGRPAPAPPRPAQPPAPPTPMVMTADEIVEREVARAAGSDSTPSSVPTTPPRHGVVFADQVPAAASTPASDSPELIELRGIHEELRAMSAMLAAAINKMPGRR